MSSAGLAPRDYSDASAQTSLDGVDVPSNEGIGDEHDFYRTPAWITHAILPHLPRGPVFDPCAGDGAILEAARAFYRERGNGLVVATSGLEIDARRAEAARGKGHPVATCDALRVAWCCPEIVVMNPPFALGAEFVAKAVAARPPWGTVAVLLRLAFLESASRAQFHRERPADVYVLANRPSFIDAAAPRPCPRCDGGAASLGGAVCSRCRGKGAIKGGSDSAAYMWAVWGPGRGGRWFVLDDVDPSKRRRGAR